jgi:hypothetical protein
VKITNNLKIFTPPSPPPRTFLYLSTSAGSPFFHCCQVPPGTSAAHSAKKNLVANWFENTPFYGASSKSAEGVYFKIDKTDWPFLPIFNGNFCHNEIWLLSRRQFSWVAIIFEGLLLSYAA